MKATSLLVKQHRQVKALFKKLESGRSPKKPLLAELADTLAGHMAIEQDIFYPAVRAIDEDLVDEGYEEHALAEIALKRLLATDPRDDAFDARVTATKELIEHHVKEEEKTLFPKVEKRLGEEKLKALGKVMQARFDEVVDGGFAAAVPKGPRKTSSDVARAHAHI
jgi:hemerythrin superfamily protein